MNQFKVDTLDVKVFENRSQLGDDAANQVEQAINKLLETKDSINMIFAAAPSQNEFFENLSKKNIQWERVNAFHMDEYVGLPEDAPQGFGNFLKRSIFEKVNFKSVNYLNGSAENAEEECERYENLLKEFPTDIVCLGVGENTHIAFNDPHVANFNDEKLVKVVDLDEACRVQQVNDGCFAAINSVPKYALTLTVPALFRGKQLFCMVPGKTKADAIKKTLTEDIIDHYPSTILRKHQNAKLFIDQESASLLSK